MGYDLNLKPNEPAFTSLLVLDESKGSDRTKQLGFKNPAVAQPKYAVCEALGIQHFENGAESITTARKSQWLNSLRRYTAASPHRTGLSYGIGFTVVTNQTSRLDY